MKHGLFPIVLILLEASIARSGDKPQQNMPGLTQRKSLPATPVVAKAILGPSQAGETLLHPRAWVPFGKGFEYKETWFVCDNGTQAKAQRGITQTVELNQNRPEPIVAVCESKAEGVTGATDRDYSLYLDLIYADNTPLWGQVASFSTGTHGWQRRQVVVLPEKPVKQVSFYMLLRGHGGKAWFRNPELHVIRTPAGACLFDGLPVTPHGPPREGFQVRDVATGSDFVRIEHEGLGLRLDVTSVPRPSWEGKSLDVTLTDTTGKDRAVTLLYAVPVDAPRLRWLGDPRRSTAVQPLCEYVSAAQFHVGANGRLSRYPLGAVAGEHHGTAIGIDGQWPASFRIGYNSGTGELYLAYDFGLTAEKPSATVRFHTFGFDPQWGFRAALARYYKICPESFRCRIPQQGMWMPFAKISAVEGWEDFGFRFKEGNDETKWDDQHGILTFRYTEPMTWWMSMPQATSRTMEAALAEARRLADQGRLEAKALFTSGYHDAEGRFVAQLLDTPWCNGAVWSMNSMPRVAGETTDFRNKWNPAIREKLYGPKRAGDLDGEYVDSSEGYVTDELDFRRDHFAAATTPLVFSPEDCQPAIFRGLIAFEYIRGIERDIHRQGKFMMANGTPSQLCWLAPLLDVMGTETDWHPRGKWQPMSDAELLYRRALCKGKPFCFLMNTRFEDFSSDLVEKYMKRCLAYGMSPGFFSADASGGQYFTRPELYNRDRPLFKRYVPLCKRVAEAGWEPITLAHTDDEHVYIERFGNRYYTVFNDSRERRLVTVALDGRTAAPGRELLSGRTVDWHDGETKLSLDGEDVAVVEMP